MANMFAQSNVNPNAYGVRPEQLGGMADRRVSEVSAAEDFIYGILSGNPQGRPNQAVVNDLMQKLTDDTFRNNVKSGMTERGMEWNPNWITQYTQPGTVRPDAYGNIQDYALKMGVMYPEAYGLMDQYQMPGGMPSHQRQRMEDGLLEQRAAHFNNRVWNPSVQGWDIPQGEQRHIFNQAGEGFGQDQTSFGNVDGRTGGWLGNIAGNIKDYMGDAFAERTAALSNATAGGVRNAANPQTPTITPEQFKAQAALIEEQLGIPMGEYLQQMMMMYEGQPGQQR